MRQHDAFSGESVIKRSSWLTGKLGENIASPLVTLVDDGRLRAGGGSDPYDGEGVVTRRNLLIDRGRCATYVYDHYHARRAGTQPTGSVTHEFVAAINRHIWDDASRFVYASERFLPTQAP